MDERTFEVPAPPVGGARERIARATLAVVAESGIEGLTHRRVSAEAGVSLGTTTYHFATLEDLVVAALGLAVEDGIRDLDQWSGGLSPERLASDLALFVQNRLGGSRGLSIIRYELYLAALRRPSLQPLSRRWSLHFEAILADFVPPTIARALSIAIDGVIVQSLVRGIAPDPGELEALLSRIVGWNTARRSSKSRRASD